jgi:hypothetical protein
VGTWIARRRPCRTSPVSGPPPGASSTGGTTAFVDPDDDDQRRIARSLFIDLSAAADRLPESFRQAHPQVDWRGIRAVGTFVAHDYDGTDEEILWQAIAVQFPAILAALLPEVAPGPAGEKSAVHPCPVDGSGVS